MSTLKKKYSVYILLLLAAAGYLLYDMQRPGCVDAQCTTITPLIRYGRVNGGSGGGCATVGSGVINLPGVGEPYIALTGWYLDYNTPPDDHQIDQLKMRIQNIIYTPATVSFNVEGCLNDNNDDDDFTFEARYVIARWI